MKDSLLNIMVVGTAEGIVMVESGAKEVSEDQVLGAIEFAHEQIKKICAPLTELPSRGGKPKRAVPPVEFDEPYYDQLNSKVVTQLADALDTGRHPRLETYPLVKRIKAEPRAERP